MWGIPKADQGFSQGECHQAEACQHEVGLQVAKQLVVGRKSLQRWLLLEDCLDQLVQIPPYASFESGWLETICSLRALVTLPGPLVVYFHPGLGFLSLFP
jgi:hypothetical protein